MGGDWPGMSPFRLGSGQPLADCGNPKQIGLDNRSLSGSGAHPGYLSTSKLGGRVMFSVWWGWQIRP